MLLRKKLQALEDPLKDSISNYPSEESNRSLGMKVEEGGVDNIYYSHIHDLSRNSQILFVTLLLLLLLFT